ncbi:MAG TPA: 4-hydroxythreonine-4-phosphate dehydrogenase PdxA [Verrucomicrobia bacterium]|nr:4-hydroxythreonine-4-phosphate dehydrogenase PdxA [Verrucomicrobiota bacterium]
MGDAAGIGPELCLRVMASPAVTTACRPVVFGNTALLRRVAAVCGVPLEATCITAAQFAATGLPPGGSSVVVDVDGLDADAVQPGRVQAACGAAAARYVELAVRAAQSGTVQAIVTAPLHKEALQRADVPYAGHTEMLAALTGTSTYCMMMASAEINVCLATTHIALAEVPARLTPSRVLEVIRLADDAMRRMGVGQPRLTVCGLNPHAGEHGLFGDEEARIIQPAVDKARALGFRVSDPLPPDTAFIPAQRRQTDAYVVMYHDQGLIPFKMLAFETGVNVTLGLPVVRTSVDHGTAFDIAWKGQASAASMTQAIQTALHLAPGCGV